jgi:prophage DNA circulation protein
MTDASNITINKDELRSLIDEAVKMGMSDIPTTDEVERMIENRLSSAVVHWGSEVDVKIEKAIDRTFTPMVDEMRKLTSQIAVLVEQIKHVNAAVRDVKDDQKDTKQKVESLDDEIQTVKESQLTTVNQVESQERAIFGDKTRPGTKSLFDHISDLGNALASEMGKGFKEIQVARELDRQEMSRIRTDTETIRADVEANKEWREKRQKVERFVIQSIPNAGKRIVAAAKDDFVVKWATRIGLGGGLAILAALLERLQ